jgi:hypothetical protein
MKIGPQGQKVKRGDASPSVAWALLHPAVILGLDPRIERGGARDLSKEA